MTINIQDIISAFELSKLDPAYGLSEKEKEEALNELEGDFKSVFEKLDIIKDADSGENEALYAIVHQTPEPRADEAIEGLDKDDILSQAPEGFANFFVVPKII